MAGLIQLRRRARVEKRLGVPKAKPPVALTLPWNPAGARMIAIHLRESTQ